MILMIDNYDSFTYNVVQYLGMLGANVQVVRNDALSIDDVTALKPSAIVISPGPCTPTEAGISVDVVQHFSGKLPLLGVCLGHQSIAQAFGATIRRADRIMHGKTSPIVHTDTPGDILHGLPNPFEATRYHSLVVEPSTLSDDLMVTATADDDGEIMGIMHRTHPTWGVQFHPESILTTHGLDLLKNFLTLGELACP
jgi:anthranilate synthase component 2